MLSRSQKWSQEGKGTGCSQFNVLLQTFGPQGIPCPCFSTSRDIWQGLIMPSAGPVYSSQFSALTGTRPHAPDPAGPVQLVTPSPQPRADSDAQACWHQRPNKGLRGPGFRRQEAGPTWTLGLACH